MFKIFLKRFVINTLAYGWFSVIFVGLILSAFGTSTTVYVAVIILFLILVAYVTNKDLVKELNKQHQAEVGAISVQKNEALKLKEEAQREEALWRQTLIEKSAGFPSLLQVLEAYEKAKDDQFVTYLNYKKHPAYKAADLVKEQTKKRREAEFENRKTKAIIEYYELVAPFLSDLKNDIIDVKQEELLKEYTEEERQDPAINYLSKEEYRKLLPIERNQRALDRFWQRPKSKWLIGRLYERYVGYLYEKEGYGVEYVGIFKGYEDLGRDLICQKGKDFIVIQCKNWAQFKKIYENHIFQFFGTVFQYRDANPSHKVKALFCTTTKLSDLARRFAGELNIELKEDFKFNQNYPCIKCNVSQGGERIYHLPFDQQYDTTKIEPSRDELYCATVKEAEDLGFRRAFRWRGNKK